MTIQFIATGDGPHAEGPANGNRGVIGATDPALARWLGASRWILIALAHGRMGLAALLDEVRSLDGPMGHGTLFAGLARLERQGLIESIWPGTRSVMYRLTTHGRDVAGGASTAGDRRL